jgi:RNA 3'-terminal phosphate cyclase
MVEDVRVTSPLVVYEMNDEQVANVDVLKKNLAAGQPARTGDRSRKGVEKRLRIKRLVIENAQAEIHVAALGNNPRTVALSRLEMSDIGGRNGAPPEEVAKQIVSAILAEVSTEVGKAGAEKLLEKGLERLLRR